MMISTRIIFNSYITIGENGSQLVSLTFKPLTLNHREWEHFIVLKTYYVFTLLPL